MTMKDMMVTDGTHPNRLLNRQEAAAFLGVREDTLAAWKSTRKYDIPVVKVGRLVRYRFADLLEFIDRRTINRPTASLEKKTR